MKDFIFFLLFLAVASGIGYYVYNSNSKLPSDMSQSVARSIVPYPESKWDLQAKKGFCFVWADKKCEVPVTVKFESRSMWSEIYSFYQKDLVSAGWKSNGNVVTSIPTSIVFTSDNGCEAVLKPAKKITGGEIEGQYNFKVVCRAS